MLRIGLLVVAACFTVAGCGRKPIDVDKVVSVSADDRQMNAAIDKARASVDSFIGAHKKPKAGQSLFAVKMALTDGKHTEHVWLRPVTYDGQAFHGAIDNELESVTGYVIGQKVTIDRSKISDWMYIENGKLKGGYTIRVLRDKLSAREKVEFDKGVGFIIE